MEIRLAKRKVNFFCFCVAKRYWRYAIVMEGDRLDKTKELSHEEIITKINEVH